MDPILGQIILWSGSFIPRDWLACEGQELQIQENMPLYSLVGVTYGGDGIKTFKLPDLRSRVPVGCDTRDASVAVGHSGGTAKIADSNAVNGNITLTATNLPAHDHSVAIPSVSTGNTTNIPGTSVHLAKGIADLTPSGGNLESANIYSNATTTDSTLAPFKTSVSGTGTATGTQIPFKVTVPNQPYLVLRYIIATVGVYPDRP